MARMEEHAIGGILARRVVGGSAWSVEAFLPFRPCKLPTIQNAPRSSQSAQTFPDQLRLGRKRRGGRRAHHSAGSGCGLAWIFQMSAADLNNPNPVVHERAARTQRKASMWGGEEGRERTHFCACSACGPARSMAAHAGRLSRDASRARRCPVATRSSIPHPCRIRPGSLIASRPPPPLPRPQVRAPVPEVSPDGAEAREPIDASEVFDYLRDITDPEHPYSLEQLNVVAEDLLQVDDAAGRIRWARREERIGQVVLEGLLYVLF
jgi:hypothetical protein